MERRDPDVADGLDADAVLSREKGRHCTLGRDGRYIFLGPAEKYLAGLVFVEDGQPRIRQISLWTCVAAAPNLILPCGKMVVVIKVDVSSGYLISGSLIE